MSGVENKVKKYINNIVNPFGGISRYKGLVLKNDLKVLLISNPNTEIAGASLMIKGGSLCDPDDLPGLAHLCEHLLFSSTKKYSKDEFKRFILINQGQFYSKTCFDYAKFTCGINKNLLGPLLDRFARMFFEPSFYESDIKRGVNTVDHFHQSKLSNDKVRVEHVIKSTVQENHPYRRFESGSEKTLRNDPNSNDKILNDRVKKFFSTWFSSHLMQLVVFGREDFETLEKLVVPLFGQIKKKNVKIPMVTTPIYEEEQLSTKTIIVPLLNFNLLSIDFLIPDQTKYFKTAPLAYLSALFNDQGPQSLITTLRRNGWCTKIHARCIEKGKNIVMFNIMLNFTLNGHEHIDEIIGVLFQYVNVLNDERPQEWFYKQIKAFTNMKMVRKMQSNFQHKSMMTGLRFLEDLCYQMMSFKMEDAVRGENFLEEWRPDIIQNLFSHIRPDNMRVIIISKEFQNAAYTEEEYYNAQYSMTKIPADVINKWENVGMNEVFKMPFNKEGPATVENNSSTNKISQRGRKRRKLATHNEPTSTKKQIKKRNSQRSIVTDGTNFKSKRITRSTAKRMCLS